MELDWTVQMARNYFAKPAPGSDWRDVPNGQVGRVLIAENDRLIARVEELEALRSKRLPFREAEIAQARYEKAEAERDALKQELDLSVKLREAADARIKELEAAIRAKCAYCRESWDAGLDDPAFCPTNCPLLPYRGGQ